MVHLGSCASGLSSVNVLGDQLAGLVWAFMYRGVSAVSATLWPLTSEAGYDMGTALASELAKGATVMEAHRRAVSRLRQQAETTHGARDWAPFVVFGDVWGGLDCAPNKVEGSTGQ